MRAKDWTLVPEETGRGRGLEPGFKVLTILSATDVPSKTYPDSGEVVLTYDVAEGPEAGACQTEWYRNNAWAHSFKKSYGTDKWDPTRNNDGKFSAFLGQLEASNPGRFSKASFASDARQLVGLQIGAAFQKRLYTNDEGKDKDTVDVVYTLPVDDCRTKTAADLPQVRDQRKKKEDAPASPQPAASNPFAQAGYDPYEDVPFN